MALQLRSGEPSTSGSHWVDETGVVHVCESAEPIGSELLVWTLCDREVESGANHIRTLSHGITCSKCAAAQIILKRRSAKNPTVMHDQFDLAP